jgi:hypothetical protein
MQGREKVSDQVKALEEQVERLMEASKFFTPMLIGLVRAAAHFGLEPNDAGVEAVFKHLMACSRREKFCDGKCIDGIRKMAKKKHRGKDVQVQVSVSLKPKHKRFAEANPLFYTYQGERRKERVAVVGDYCQFCGGRRDVPTVQEPETEDAVKSLGEAVAKNGRIIDEIERSLGGIEAAFSGPFG